MLLSYVGICQNGIYTTLTQSMLKGTALDGRKRFVTIAISFISTALLYKF